jgi:hypothetical protein
VRPLAHSEQHFRLTNRHYPAGEEIDFDAAASQFPDISLDGLGDIPSLPTQAPPISQSSSGFTFDDFNTPLDKPETIVKVTGDDEIEKFENEFPELDPTPVSRFNMVYLSNPLFLRLSCDLLIYADLYA